MHSILPTISPSNFGTGSSSFPLSFPFDFGMKIITIINTATNNINRPATIIIFFCFEKQLCFGTILELTSFNPTNEPSSSSIFK